MFLYVLKTIKSWEWLPRIRLIRQVLLCNPHMIARMSLHRVSKSSHFVFSYNCDIYQPIFMTFRRRRHRIAGSRRWSFQHGLAVQLVSAEIGRVTRPVSWRSLSVQRARGRPGRRLQSRPSERPDDRATWQWRASCAWSPLSEPSYVAEYWQTTSSDEVHDRW